MAAGCLGAMVGGHQARNPDRRTQGNSRRPSGQGPGAGLSKGLAAQGPPASTSSPPPTLPPAPPHRRADSNHQAAATQPVTTRTTSGISRPATVPRDETALNVTSQAHCHPGQAPNAYSQLGGYRTSSATQCKLRRVMGETAAPRRRSPNRASAWCLSVAGQGGCITPRSAVVCSAAPGGLSLVGGSLVRCSAVPTRGNRPRRRCPGRQRRCCGAVSWMR